MRTAEDYLKEHLQSLDWQSEPNKVTTAAMYLRSIDAINTARREALEEAADKIIIDGNPANAKQSILNMVNELG